MKKARGLSKPISAREGKADRPVSRAAAALRPYGLDAAGCPSRRLSTPAAVSTTISDETFGRISLG